MDRTNDEGNKPELVDFIRNIIKEDLASGKHQTIATRFPPEPNGYLHIGHAKAIVLNFGVAKENAGTTNLRFDDTNPEKEKDEYANAIKEDIQWLGYRWKNLLNASDYFERIYELAEELIQQGNAFVCSLSADEIRAQRGTLQEPGKNSPYRDRTIEENLDLFRRMRAGEFADGEHVLRAKIDMSSGNINMRDPVIYRIKKVRHHKTGDKWCIYPMYDFTHCISDALEGITHSLCTLEFQDHRPLYNWFLDHLKLECHPRQIEFAALSLNYTITSKRRLKLLVEKDYVSGWDDPRLPTIKGMRRRGYPPEAIVKFCELMGVSKKETTLDLSILEDQVRNELNGSANRAFAILDPLKVTIINYPDDKEEWLQAPNHPQLEERGKRKIPFSKHILIEREDFLEDAPKKFFRLAPEREVRLRYGYIIRCDEVIKDSTGQITELKCSMDHDTLGKNPEGRKVKGIIHWLSETHAKPIEVRMYDRLFCAPNPASHEDFLEDLNPESLKVIETAYLEPTICEDLGSDLVTLQFERLGYFTTDMVSAREKPVFNRTVTLRDSWAKQK